MNYFVGKEQLVDFLLNVVGIPDGRQKPTWLDINYMLNSTRDGSLFTNVEYLNTIFKRKIPGSAYDLLKQMLQPHPIDRITAEDALDHPFFDEDFHELGSIEMY